MGDLFDQVEILLSIRRPVDTAVSLWSTGLKSGLRTSALPPPAAPYWHRICNHRQTVELWQRYFPVPLHIRLFSRREFVDGDLLADFCQACGIARGDQLCWPGEEDNQTLSWPAMKLLIELNKRIPRFQGKQIKYLRGDLAKYISRHFPGIFPMRHRWKSARLMKIALLIRWSGFVLATSPITSLCSLGLRSSDPRRGSPILC